MATASCASIALMTRSCTSQTAFDRPLLRSHNVVASCGSPTAPLHPGAKLGNKTAVRATRRGGCIRAQARRSSGAHENAEDVKRKRSAQEAVRKGPLAGSPPNNAVPYHSTSRSAATVDAPNSLKEGLLAGESEEEKKEDLLGFEQPWEVELVRFWRDYGKIRDNDIRLLVNLGHKYSFFAKTEVLVSGIRKLNTLLPDANVPNMLQREPEILSLDFVRASQRILQLQELLCSADQCYEVTGILERCPRLLLCEDIPSQVEAAVAHLQHLAPESDAKRVVKENPELIYRIQEYTDRDELPISIQNMLLETYSEDAVPRAEYNEEWDRRECELDEKCDPDTFSFEDWMMDGYYDPDDEGFSYKPGWDDRDRT